MIRGEQLYLQYGDRILMNRVDFTIMPNDKVGLVGRNGAGKSTLLKIIAQELSPDSGRVHRPNLSTIGFLHQELTLPKGRTVMEETLTAFEEVRKLEQRIEELNQEISSRTDYESQSYLDLIQDLTDSNERFDLLGGQNMEAEAERVLKGLGFKSEELDRPTATFSGGWQMRIVLAKMLLQQPDYLLLDEPTNHLDIESILWLEQFLATYPKAVVTISHDKTFLDHVTERTLEITLGKLYDYKASYSKYLKIQAERREMQEAAYKNQQRDIAQKERTINRFMAKATKTKMAQSMKKQLDKVERIELDQLDGSAMNINFPPAPRSGEVVVQGKEVFKSYGDNEVLKGVDLKILRGQKIAFVGQNGQGKTTLARMVIGEVPLSKGELELGYNIHLGYYAQNQSDTLDGNRTVLESIEAVSPPDMRTKLRSILGAFMFSGEDVDKKVSVLSGGEKARLALACLLLKPINLLVLDEPTNHLDIPSKDVLKQAIARYDGSLIIVSHDRDFLSDLTDTTIEFRDYKLHQHIGDVNAFLEKRKVDNMRQVELRDQAKKQNASSGGEQKPIVDHETRKKAQRALKNAEKKIERLESEMEKIQLEMAKTDFYERPDQQKVISKYQEMKDQLDQAMEAWEAAQEAWDEMGG